MSRKQVDKLSEKFRKSFYDGQFKKALQTAGQLCTITNNDPFFVRYKAICLRRIKNCSEAEEVGRLLAETNDPQYHSDALRVLIAHGLKGHVSKLAEQLGQTFPIDDVEQLTTVVFYLIIANETKAASKLTMKFFRAHADKTDELHKTALVLQMYALFYTSERMLKRFVSKYFTGDLTDEEMLMLCMFEGNVSAIKSLKIDTSEIEIHLRSTLFHMFKDDITDAEIFSRYFGEPKTLSEHLHIVKVSPNPLSVPIPSNETGPAVATEIAYWAAARGMAATDALLECMQAEKVIAPRRLARLVNLLPHEMRQQFMVLDVDNPKPENLDMYTVGVDIIRKFLTNDCYRDATAMIGRMKLDIMDTRFLAMLNDKCYWSGLQCIQFASSLLRQREQMIRPINSVFDHFQLLVDLVQPDREAAASAYLSIFPTARFDHASIVGWLERGIMSIKPQTHEERLLEYAIESSDKLRGYLHVFFE
ncbi:hypothetical protein PCE1_000086 [Barthelona sp. PCE]